MLKLSCIIDYSVVSARKSLQKLHRKVVLLGYLDHITWSVYTESSQWDETNLINKVEHQIPSSLCSMHVTYI